MAVAQGNQQGPFGTLVIAGSAFTLQERSRLGDARRELEVIGGTSPDVSTKPGGRPAILWLDSGGIVTLVTRLPECLIDSPALGQRARIADIAIHVPLDLIEGARIKLGDQLTVTLPRERSDAHV